MPAPSASPVHAAPPCSRAPPQTGSGKTFTITGGAMHYADRGIIPRTLSCIFSEVSKRTDHQYQVRAQSHVPRAAGRARG